MPATSEQIENILTSEGLEFFKSLDDDGGWIIPFACHHVHVRLKEAGEYIWFRGSLLANLEDSSTEKQQQALQHFMSLNDRIKLGRFCGFPLVAFEIGLPVEDGELTGRQFLRCLGATSETTHRERYTVPTREEQGMDLLQEGARFPKGFSPEMN